MYHSGELPGRYQVSAFATGTLTGAYTVDTITGDLYLTNGQLTKYIGKVGDAQKDSNTQQSERNPTEQLPQQLRKYENQIREQMQRQRTKTN